jgi:molybdopterin converting factor small subunit
LNEICGARIRTVVATLGNVVVVDVELVLSDDVGDELDEDDEVDVVPAVCAVPRT